MSKHIWFVVGSMMITFVGVLIAQPAVVQWMSLHWIYDALITSLGITFHGFNTYWPKQQPLPAELPTVPNVPAAKN